MNFETYALPLILLAVVFVLHFVVIPWIDGNPANRNDQV